MFTVTDGVRPVEDALSDNEDIVGRLVIHRDIPGDHEDSECCWCNPHIIYEDDLRTTEQIIRDMELVERKQ